MDSPLSLTRKTRRSDRARRRPLILIAREELEHGGGLELHPQATSTPTCRGWVAGFPALQNESGSVRIAINPINGNSAQWNLLPGHHQPGTQRHLLRGQSALYPPGMWWRALDASSNEMNCFCHGSAYARSTASGSGPGDGVRSPNMVVPFDGSDVVSVVIPALSYTVAIQPLAVSGKRWLLTLPVLPECRVRGVVPGNPGRRTDGGSSALTETGIRGPDGVHREIGGECETLRGERGSQRLLIRLDPRQRGVGITCLRALPFCSFKVFSNEGRASRRRTSPRLPGAGSPRPSCPGGGRAPACREWLVPSWVRVEARTANRSASTRSRFSSEGSDTILHASSF